MKEQEKRLADSESPKRSLLLRCKSVEGLATQLTSELQSEKRDLRRLMRGKEQV